MIENGLRFYWQRILWVALLSCVLFSTLLHQPAMAQPPEGSWVEVEGATVVKGPRVYARGIGYYTDNTVSLGGANPTGELRIAVTSSSLPVNNADGTDDGVPFFTLGSAGDTTRIYFDLRRARFAYTAVLQEFVVADPDADDDGVPDADDNCPNDPNPGQEDEDNDGIGDVCDPVNDDDIDDDGVDNDDDNCPNDPNPGQEDEDNDGIGDVCDPINDDDLDDDGVDNDVDNCPNDPNPGQEDEDNDGIGDVCDPINDDDLDDDGVDNDVDNCPNDPNPGQEDEDNDGIGDICDPVNDDPDGDGVNNDVDNCPNDPNPGQEDVDQDGIGDVCDPVDNRDSDDDGIPDDEDLCPDDPTNSCLTLTGTVFGGGATLDGANVKIGTNTVNTSTDAAGGFGADVGNGESSSNSAGMFFPVEVTADGFSTGNVSVDYVPGQTEYEVTITLVQVSTSIEEDDDLNEGVDVTTEGETVGSLTIPDGSLPDGVTDVTGEITYLDPETNDISSGPDLVALAPGEDPNDSDETPVTLETFGMMDFNLQDQNGNEISELDGPAQVCMRAPDGLVLGEMVPLWYYDEDIALWVQEGEGTVVDVDGVLQICGDVTHFTWWNYDRPITTHSCFRFQMKDADTGLPITGLSWYAEGVTYNGTSPQRFCNDTPEGFDSLTVKISDPDTEEIRVYTQIEGIRYYLRRLGEDNYDLTTNADNGTVFDTPELQGSCLSGTRTGFCENLDYLDLGPDGMLSIDIGNINLPPVISMFDLTGSIYTLLVGESTTATATVTDPEGTPVSVEWAATCFGAGGESISPTVDGPDTSPATFSTLFTAPGTLDFLFETCQIELTATDADGNSSTAYRYVTVVGNTDFLFTGQLIGTDGNPLPFYPVDYFNFCNGESINEGVATDDQGFFAIPVDLAACGFSPEEIFFGQLGQLEVFYQNCPGGGPCEDWQRTQFLEDPFGGELGGDFILDCTPVDDGPTECISDIILPTLWTDLTCVHHRTEEEASGRQLLSFDHEDLYGNAYVFDSFFAVVDGPPGQYAVCPGQVPLGQMFFSLSQEMVGGSFTYLGGFFFSVPSLEPLTQDVADSGDVTVPTTVTVYDSSGDPLPGYEVDVFFNSFFDTASLFDLPTDANGQVIFDAPLGDIGFVQAQPAVQPPFDFVYGGGAARVPGQPLLIDLDGPGTCTVTGRAFDPFNQPLVDRFAPVSNQNGRRSNFFEVLTDGNGDFSFPAFPGQLFLDSGGFTFTSDIIESCQGDPTVRRDVRVVDDFFNDDS